MQRESVAALQAGPVLEELPKAKPERKTEDRRAGLCPYGHGILTRAKVTWDDPCYLERCSKCGGVWVDAGEWQRLLELGLVTHLDDVWEPSWRRQLQADEAAAHLRVELRQKLGPELAAAVETLAATLGAHPHRALALAFLQDAVRNAPPDLKEERSAKVKS